MTDPTPSLFAASPPGRQVRLRTLTALRWAAVIGQIGAIVVAQSLFGLQIALWPAGLAIGASVVANALFQLVFPQNKRLDSREATLVLTFDTMQLGGLLVATGGLSNPFAMLIVAPVTVAAMALPLRATLMVGLVAVALATAMIWSGLPLRDATGTVLDLPAIFKFGHWVAILTAVGFVGVYTRRVSIELQTMAQGLLATQMALAREQKLTDLGGVVAAAAHELGTPLATIKLVSGEMLDELETGSELYDDAALIRAQADRCRDILHSMGRTGKDDLHLRQAPLRAVIEEAADPHRDRGKEIVLRSGTPDPMVLRRPELIHALRNLIQNAVDFAATTVWVETLTDADRITLRITDDGCGFPPQLIGRIGDPFIGHGPRPERDSRRPEYEGMGLGLFIAKTLLERTGAELRFGNRAKVFTGAPHPGEPLGAMVEVTWPRGVGETGIEADDRMPALGQNQTFEA